MAENDAGEKSQDPTPHRRQQAREEGQVVQSQDLTSTALLLGALLVLALAGGSLLDFFLRVTSGHLGGEAWLSTDRESVVNHWNTVLWELAKALLPVLGVLMLIGAALPLAQIGFLVVPEKLAPDLSRVNPLSGLQRLFSLSSLVRLALGIFKIAIVGAVAYYSLAGRRDELVALGTMALPDIARFIWDICLWTGVKIGLALLALALLDYGYQRWKYERDLRMTPQEVREEMRNLQGDPQMIARRRQVQRQLSLHRVANAVPKADVVVTNPTELAVAIQYDPQTMQAPIVLAKGAGTVARRIRQLALEHGVPIVEKKPLAQALFKDVEVNRPIPAKLYATVAEVLAYVYQLKGKRVPGQAA